MSSWHSQHLPHGTPETHEPSISGFEIRTRAHRLPTTEERPLIATSAPRHRKPLNSAEVGRPASYFKGQIRSCKAGVVGSNPTGGSLHNRYGVTDGDGDGVGDGDGDGVESSVNFEPRTCTRNDANSCGSSAPVVGLVV